MSEPSTNLDLTALNDALGDDDRQALREETDKAGVTDMKNDSAGTKPPSSATSQPASTANIPAAPTTPAAAPEETHPDQNVRNIKAMFPDMDVDTIQAVLVADGGDFERGEDHSSELIEYE
jgi:hypothetical protein